MNASDRRFQIWKGIFCFLTAVFAAAVIWFLFKADDSYSYERYLESLPAGEEPGVNGGAVFFIIYAVCVTALSVLGGSFCLRSGAEYFRGETKRAMLMELFAKGVMAFAVFVALSCARMWLARIVYGVFLAYLLISITVTALVKIKQKKN